MTVTAPRVQLRYGDKVLDSGSGGVHRHLNPYTGQVQAEIPPERRRDVLMRFAALLDEHRAEFAASVSASSTTRSTGPGTTQAGATSCRAS
jgi:aldehyde dehydrogenase (NAD+)